MKPIRELEKYINEIKVPLSLRLWSFEIEEGVEGNSAAEITVTYGQRHARIAFREGWFEEWGPIYLRHVCTHELIHCHFEPLRWNMNNLERLIGQIAFPMYEAQFIDLMEVAIDDLASSFAPKLPKPSFITAKK